MDEITGQIVGGREIISSIQNVTPRVRQNVRDAINKMQYRLQRVISENYLRGDPLHRRSGNLASSISVRPIEETAADIRGPVGTNTVYARMQEMGGTITPKRAANLTIPLNAALTGAGVMRWSARQIIENPGAGGYEGTFFRKGILFGKTGGSIVPLFALRKSVTLPARPFMAPALQAVKAEYEAELSKAVQKAAEDTGFK